MYFSASTSKQAKYFLVLLLIHPYMQGALYFFFPPAFFVYKWMFVVFYNALCQWDFKKRNNGSESAPLQKFLLREYQNIGI